MRIDYEQVLRYLGFHSDAMNSEEAQRVKKQIDDCASELTILSGGGASVYSVFDVAPDDEHAQVKLQNTVVGLAGNDIAAHLFGCRKCALMAVTLGVQVERTLAYHSKLSLSKALVMDAVASMMVEVVCDQVEEQIQKEASLLGMSITTRYSPGYGDLSLTHQKPILQALDAQRRIGLTVNESNLLLPRKSVTAIIGFSDGVRSSQQAVGCGRADKCNTCTMKNCRYRRVGTDNGK